MRLPYWILQPFLLILTIGLISVLGFAATECVEYHSKVSPGIVADWQTSRHGATGLNCATCHGSEHSTAGDGINRRHERLRRLSQDRN
jgi:hypothetical protein